MCFSHFNRSMSYFHFIYKTNNNSAIGGPSMMECLQLVPYCHSPTCAFNVLHTFDSANSPDILAYISKAFPESSPSMCPESEKSESKLGCHLMKENI